MVQVRLYSKLEPREAYDKLKTLNPRVFQVDSFIKGYGTYDDKSSQFETKVIVAVQNSFDHENHSPGFVPKSAVELVCWTRTCKNYQPKIRKIFEILESPEIFHIGFEHPALSLDELIGIGREEELDK